MRKTDKMRLIQDLPTRQVFKELRSGCIPKESMMNDDRSLVVVFLVTLAVIAGALNFIFIASMFGICAVLYWWRMRFKAKHKLHRYVFDLIGNTLSLEGDALLEAYKFISVEKYSTFVVEFVPSCYRVTLIGASRYTIYSRSEPPTDEFIDALKRIGLHEIDNQ